MIEKDYNNHHFQFYDSPTISALVAEIFSDNYDVFKSKILIRPGDVILDLGACEGVFSILMAKSFPQSRIISLEPVPSTYALMIKNIALNACTNIVPLRLGVAKNVGKSILFTHDQNSGGSTSWCTFIEGIQTKTECDFDTLDNILTNFMLDKVRLLKIDIEGAEYEVLYSFKRLSDVEYFTGEVHINNRLEYQSRRVDGLISWISNRTNIIHVDVCKMAE